MENISLVDYSRQEAMDASLSVFRKTQLNVIIGCGGVGFWLGLFLAMNGHKHFILMDKQKIEPSNLNRLPVPQTWIGINKAIALKRLMRTLRPDVCVSPFTTHITEDTLGLLTEFVNSAKYCSVDSKVFIWDTTDDGRIQKKINKAVAKIRADIGSRERVQYRKIGYEGWEVGNYSNFDVWINEETYETGYRTSNANAMTSAVSASLGIFAGGLGYKEDVQVNLKDLMSKISGLTHIQTETLLNSVWKRMLTDEQRNLAAKWESEIKRTGKIPVDTPEEEEEGL